MILKNLSKSFVILVLLTMNAFANEETPRFTLIEREKNFEVRDYSEMVVAKTESDNSDNAMFRKLANYIFGGNESGLKIKMTAPVFMQSKEGQKSMMFYMPSKYNLEALPEPNSQEVQLGTVNLGRVAVIKYSGFNPMRKRKANFEKLLNWMDKKGLESFDNNFYSAGYDSPWTLPWNRKNEVLVLLK